VTYRDTEDALRARIQALESKLAQRAQERFELQRELSQAQKDLAAMQQEQEPPRPRALLALGVAGACLTAVAILLLGLIRVVEYAPWLYSLAYGAADIGLGLGMLGFYRVTRQRLALAAAILLLLGPLDSLLHSAISSLGFGFNYLVWLRTLALGLVQGLVLVQAPGRYLRPWKRNLAGVLCFVTVFFGALSFAFFAVRLNANLNIEALEQTLEIQRYVSYPSLAAYLAKNVALLLCFLELRGPGLTGAAPEAS